MASTVSHFMAFFRGSGNDQGCKLHAYTVHQTMLKTFYYQLMHIMLKNTELLKNSKITLLHVSVYIETIFRELQSVLG